MLRSSRTLAAGLLSLTLVGGGIAACSGGGSAPAPAEKSDVAACEALETASGTLLESDDTDDEDAAFDAYRDDLMAASELAESPELATDLKQFGDLLIQVLESDDEDDSVFELAITMKTLSATCAEEAVDMSTYEEVLEQMGFNEFTIEELEELMDFLEEFGDLEDD